LFRFAIQINSYTGEEQLVHYRFECGYGRRYNIPFNRWDLMLAFLAMRKGASTKHDRHPTSTEGVSP